jgi:hypothetical protein
MTLCDEPAELDIEPILGGRCDSTPENRERFAFLKTKCKDAAWQEGRMGPLGVTALDPNRMILGGPIEDAR